MEKYTFLFIFFFIAIFEACTSSTNNTNSLNDAKESADNQISFFTTDTATTFIMDTLDNKSPRMSIKISLPFTKNKNAIEGNINTSIIYAAFGLDNMSPQAAIDSVLKTARTDYLSLRPNYLNEKGMQHSAAWLNYELEVKGCYSTGYKNTINYTISSHTYNGGAHGLDTYAHLNFDAQSGEETKLQDLFIEDFEESLTATLLSTLAKQIGVATIDEIEPAGYISTSEFYPTENFLLEKDSIVFLYNEYEIAPYYMGKTRIAVGYNQLENILKK